MQVLLNVTVFGILGVAGQLVIFIVESRIQRELESLYRFVFSLNLLKLFFVFDKILQNTSANVSCSDIRITLSWELSQSYFAED